MPLCCTLYGYESSGGDSAFAARYSMLNAQGFQYPTFSVGEYQIIGAYSYQYTGLRNLMGNRDILEDATIMPAASMAEREENTAYLAPMTASNTSFTIPNGTTEAFDQALRAAIPK